MPGFYQTTLTCIVEQVSNLFLRKPKTSATRPSLLMHSPIR